MFNALGQPQTIVLLGGTSDIGLATVRALTTPATRRVVLGCRDTDRGAQAAATLQSADVSADVPADLAVDVVHFDASDLPGIEASVNAMAELCGDVDVCIIASAVLGDAAESTTQPDVAAHIISVNMTGAVAASIAMGNRMRAQGHGSLVVLSSVAGERVRAADPVYGATKAGLDGFAQGYADAVRGDGVRVLVVRPGFVHSKMTAGRKAAPFSTTPDKVAAATVRALRTGQRTVWAPGILRFVFSALRHLPGPVWRRLPI